MDSTARADRVGGGSKAVHPLIKTVQSLLKNSTPLQDSSTPPQDSSAPLKDSPKCLSKRFEVPLQAFRSASPGVSRRFFLLECLPGRSFFVSSSAMLRVRSSTEVQQGVELS